MKYILQTEKHPISMCSYQVEKSFFIYRYDNGALKIYNLVWKLNIVPAVGDYAAGMAMSVYKRFAAAAAWIVDLDNAALPGDADLCSPQL